MDQPSNSATQFDFAKFVEQTRSMSREERESIEIAVTAICFIEDGTSGWNVRTIPLDASRFDRKSMHMAVKTLAAIYFERNCLVRLDDTIPSAPTLRFTNLMHINHERTQRLTMCIASRWDLQTGDPTDSRIFRISGDDRALLPYVIERMQTGRFRAIQLEDNQPIGHALKNYAESRPEYASIDGTRRVDIGEDWLTPFEGTAEQYRDLLLDLCGACPWTLLIVCPREPNADDAELVSLLENLRADFRLIILENDK